ncbi:START domain-containing protein [Entamoeba marina]
MSCEIPDIPYVNKPEELLRMEKPLHMWLSQMFKQELITSPPPFPEVIDYSISPLEKGQYIIKCSLQINTKKLNVLNALNDIPLMKSFATNTNELRFLLIEQNNSLIYEQQLMPYGHNMRPREFVYVTCKYTRKDGDYIVSSSVNNSKENKLNDKYVRGYKKTGLHIYEDSKSKDTTFLNIVLVADARGNSNKSVTTQFLLYQLYQFVLLKLYLEKK